MSATLINLIIQLIAGAVGGNAVGAGLKNFDLGTIGNTIAGALGGAGGGTLLTALLPILQGAAGGVDIGQLVGQAVGGGVAKMRWPAKRRDKRQGDPGGVFKRRRAQLRT
jgi:hypothetical protein